MQSNFPKVSIYVFVIFVVFAASLFKIADLDFWWHLKTGQVTLEQKQFQRTEIYSFTAAGREYIDHEWLFQVVMFWFYSKFGPAGAIILKSAIFSLIYVLTTRYLLLQNTSPFLIFAIQFLSICGGLPRMIERPEIFTALFFITTFLTVDYSLRNHKRAALIFLPPLFAIWSNFHAAVILGLILLGIFAIGLVLEFLIRREQYPIYYNPSVKDLGVLLLVLIVCTVASGVNPYGYRVLTVPFELTSIIDSGILNNDEWKKPSPFTLPFYYICVLFAFAMALLNFRRLSIVHFLLMCFFAYISMKYIRNTGMFCWFLPLFVGPYVKDISQQYKWQIQIGAALALLSLIYLTTFAFPFERGIGIASYFPQRLSVFTKQQNLQGNMLNSYAFGGYLIWSLYPERKIFIDGRNEVYLPLLQKIVKSRVDNRQWNQLLNEYQIDYAILNYVDDLEKVTYMNPNKESFVVYMPFTETHFPRSRWALIFWDDTGMVLVRRKGQNSNLLPMEFRNVFPEGSDYMKQLVVNGKISKAEAISQLERKLREDSSCRRAKNLLESIKTL
jgi:hypothetical protein